MIWTIAGLLAVALILIFCEVLLPGGVLGVLAACCMIAATAITGTEYGFFTAVAVFTGSLFAALILTIAELKFFAKTRYGRAFFLRETVYGRSNTERAEDSTVGKTGTALTRLNPTGKVCVDNRSHQAFSEDGYVEAGESVKVVSQDNFKLIIQKL